MKASKEDILLVEDFLDGKLDQQQLKAFNMRMQSDAAFAKLVELRKKLEPEYQRAAEYEQLKSKVGNIIEREERHPSGIRPVWVFSIAASVILLIGIYIIFLATNNDNDQSDQLAEADTTEVMKMDEPEEYATKMVLTITLTSPVLDESYALDDAIELKWETPEAGEADLYIKSQSGRKVLINKRISLSDEKYTLDSGLLPAGAYTWYINDSITTGSFKISK